ncbi:lipopolysaccharide biosynthesis protein [Halomonas sp. ML-15]|uniref:lipopolysaccharide biosynthesis protein n=1 Tax=Halomonas sp. ML-15 TaxID=2773305 RepID=UPI001745E109|nr:lipopolysaccharide biosynthesis protein [Halomonas sp. ML-15]MBD3896238.1 lipopolysaccharide biosynthesis protein [Halomonas sp. ML-15]
MLRARTVSGIFWTFLEQASKRGISLLVTLLLARLLLPEDFGLLAMISVFVTIASSLMESGIKQAVIRKKVVDQDDLNTAFYANISLGILAYFILYGSAPYIASFYDEERITLLVRVAGMVVLINSFHIIQSAVLTRDLNFRLQLKASIPASFISGIVAVFVAYSGGGVWALIVQLLFNSLLLAAFLWWMQNWRPSLSFDFKVLKELYSFGYKLFLASFLSLVAKNIYVLVIASIFGAAVAGLYYFAHRIKELVIDQLVRAIQKVTYPALSKLQDEDERLKEGYRKVLCVTTFVLFPCITMTAALASPIFEVAFPDRWSPAIAYLQLMCIASLLYPLHAINLNILKVKGRSDLYLGISVFKKIMTFSILFVSYRFGVVGILIGQIFLGVLAYLPNSYYSDKLISYSTVEQVKDFFPAFIVSAIISGVAFWAVQLSYFPPLLEILLYGVLGGVFYILLCFVFKVPGCGLFFEMVGGRFPVIRKVMPKRRHA